ncbi:universal stress protein [Actinomadura madurae]|uniref:universal stress protein n=1 Tax=Actinomadura madurae TaxID=1993 RepID=UPI002027063D|nr:universal stress protein [Actinomadura madurae]MCP9948989.1 universal stress protein [Actinomadura madurae]MCQ0010247.1 universal stress protein [Actinomadura madurae]MCQ0014441.1 universal stress protein [Actinomadura madurae]URM94591.1 universal stress protein [Actinomadura madurae]
MSDQRSTILVGTDGSTPSDRAIGWAADEAARYGKILRILHVVETSTLDLPGHTTDGISEGLVESGNQILRNGQSLALQRQPGLKVETVLVHDRDVPAGLRRYAGEAVEVVIGHRGRGGFTELLLGSTGLRLAGHYPGPVIVVRDQTGTTAGEVVVGLDLTEDPEPALDYAFAAAAARGARLRALHAWRPAPLAAKAGVDLQGAARTLLNHLAAVLAPWQDRHPDIEIVRDVVIGHPVDELVESGATADLVVVGSRGRSFPLGSVSHGVIHHARCPVAVVRPYD